MKKIVFALVTSIVFCTFNVFSQETKFEKYDATSEMAESIYIQGDTAQLFGEDDDKGKNPDKSDEPDAQTVKEFNKRVKLGLINHEETINVGDLGIEIKHVKSLYVTIIREQPKELCYVSESFGFSYNNSSETQEDCITDVIAPIYTISSNKEIEEVQKRIDNATDEILMLIDDEMTDFEKIMTVHDYMVLNYEYDMSVYENNGTEIRDITIMYKKKGVCQSYAYAFKHVMNKLGIECSYVVWDNPEKDQYGNPLAGHIWNIVKVDGKWYHIDLTHDDPIPDYFAQVQHNHAMISTQKIESLPIDHEGCKLPEGIVADSTEYENAPWSSANGAVVTIGGTMYYIDGNNVVDENKNVIHKHLDGGDNFWHITQTGGFGESVFSGLASYGGKLFFNTEKAIYMYDTKTQEKTKFLQHNGLCGLFVDGDKLVYAEFDVETSRFVKAGETYIGYMRITENLVKSISDLVVKGITGTLSGAELVAADVYKDGEINIKDLIQMRKIIFENK